MEGTKKEAAEGGLEAVDMFKDEDEGEVGPLKACTVQYSILEVGIHSAAGSFRCRY